jgi:hypothetical protein
MPEPRELVAVIILALLCLPLAAICCSFTPPGDEIDAGRQED